MGTRACVFASLSLKFHKAGSFWFFKDFHLLFLERFQRKRMGSFPKVQNQHNKRLWKSAEEKARVVNIKGLYKGYMHHIS